MQTPIATLHAVGCINEHLKFYHIWFFEQRISILANHTSKNMFEQLIQMQKQTNALHYSTTSDNQITTPNICTVQGHKGGMVTMEYQDVMVEMEL